MGTPVGWLSAGGTPGGGPYGVHGVTAPGLNLAAGGFGAPAAQEPSVSLLGTPAAGAAGGQPAVYPSLLFPPAAAPQTGGGGFDAAAAYLSPAGASQFGGAPPPSASAGTPRTPGGFGRLGGGAGGGVPVSPAAYLAAGSGTPSAAPGGAGSPWALQRGGGDAPAALASPAPPPIFTLGDRLAEGDAEGGAGAASTAQQQHHHHHHHHHQHAADGAAGDCWVTLFGFGPDDNATVLREFQRCDEIVSFGSFAPAPTNFVHVKFATPAGVQRALIRNGELLTPTLIVGVKALDPRHRASIAEDGDAAAPPAALPRIQPTRAYRLDQGAPLPAPARSTWSKVTEYVFGL